ncbi:MAG: alanine--tRNA ligase [Bacteroidetes bacterium GWF2_38_335]|nr:MAG: alanine--tRNA ligase [Bacteroidetes bacterium GWF2_38_335]OFY80108.1 MAG: alanine--tRNA ligase [Bacteroidetes bacterium RIFOXYA12_FULL_38_20]HBS88565.1 alanine--tRNA ligase [Bacteroidales bacterium]
MKANEIRDAFLNYFKSKNHHIVPSAPMVVKNDPTLMFTNAGMNQFKDIFLGNAPAKYPRIADSQKCLRVSGKHNDLEEVGHDTYHHTMFEMLGNWSFGDYFKKDAIDWGWEFLTSVMKLDKERLYSTYFEGSKDDKLDADSEALNFWKQYLPEARILKGSKKDNFWEMGDTGPCGPCSEIHVDLRSDEERKKVDGASLVNTGNPLVVEIWNLVFIQFNRKADGSLESLPAKHVDTGMGFERLCMAVQKKESNYDTDVFQPVIKKIEDISGLHYRPEDKNHKQAEIINIAMRVIADHIRAISFSIADGQLPSNTGAGYVIRRILRRAVRYGYQSLNLKEPFLFRLVPALAHHMGKAYPELETQKMLIEKVIQEEEISFYRTLETGLKRIDQHCITLINQGKSKIIEGKLVFDLYDTYGFPVDLTALIAKTYGLDIDEKGYEAELNNQKDRSRKATEIDTGDWTELSKIEKVEFVGYDQIETEVAIVKYRKVKMKGKESFQIVLNKTPFYAEGGGQVGDTGYLTNDTEKIEVIDTKQENNQIIHFVNELPENLNATFTAVVNNENREHTAANHSATHLLHYALKQVLGNHVEQKGSLVNPDHLRFDFAHFQKLTDEEIEKVEAIVNDVVRSCIALDEKRNLPINEAKSMGAVSLFGEKYGETVRVIRFGESMEFCGGIHVHNTGKIGFFKITSEGAIAAGIRRIEAITGRHSEQYLNEQIKIIKGLQATLKGSKDLVKGVEDLMNQNAEMAKQIELFQKDRLKNIAQELKSKIVKEGDINLFAGKLEVSSAAALKDIAYMLKADIENLVLILGAEIDGKANVAVMISDNLIAEKGLNAGAIIKEISAEIQGGGGGQPFFATAGGKNPAGIEGAINKAKKFIFNK